MSVLTSFLAAIPGACAQGLIWGIMAIGVFLTFRVLDFADLTVDGSFATGGAVLVTCMMRGIPVGYAMLIAFAAGCIAGLITGLLNTVFGIPGILAGILTQLALYSMNLRILAKADPKTTSAGVANQSINFRNHFFLINQNNINQTLIVVGIFIVVIIAILYWFFDTELGASIRATGANVNMARANGINVKTNTLITLALSNGLVALAGAFLSQYQGSADINMGRGAIVIGLAAVIIGEVIFGKIFKNFALRLLAAALGGVLYYLIMQLAISVGLNTNDLKLISALIVAIFLGVPYWKANYDQKHIKTTPSKDKEVNADA